MEIRLEPSLSTCIETVAKRGYERVLSKLLRGNGQDKPLEEELELLRLFLESADFKRFRSLSEKPLLEGRRVEFILRTTESAPAYAIEMEVNDP